MYETVGGIRMGQFFDIVTDLPESQPALADVRECLKHTSSHARFIQRFSAAIKQRLLHPGAPSLCALKEDLSASTGREGTFLSWHCSTFSNGGCAWASLFETLSVTCFDSVACFDLEDTSVSGHAAPPSVSQKSPGYVLTENVILSSKVQSGYGTGAATPDIISQYVGCIKALREVDPAGILLNAVGGPIKAYLRSRRDTIRCILASLTNDPDAGEAAHSESLFEELQQPPQPEVRSGAFSATRGTGHFPGLSLPEEPRQLPVLKQQPLISLAQVRGQHNARQHCRRESGSWWKA